MWDLRGKQKTNRKEREVEDGKYAAEEVRAITWLDRNNTSACEESTCHIVINKTFIRKNLKTHTRPMDIENR
jgi:hypothetical protein